MVQQIFVGRGPSLSRPHDHTLLDISHSKDSPGRVISHTLIPLPDNTKHSQGIEIHATGGIRTHIPIKLTATDPSLRSRGHWNRLLTYVLT